MAMMLVPTWTLGAEAADSPESSGSTENPVPQVEVADSEEILEDLLKIAQKEGISYEVAKKNWELQESLRPYIDQIRKARTKDFAGFWWSFEQPLTATFATSGDVTNFTEFVLKTISHLDPEVRGIVRVVEAGKSIEQLTNLRATITQALGNEGYTFDSDIDIINGKITLTTTSDQIGALSVQVASLPDVSAETMTQIIRIKSGSLAMPSEPGYGGRASSSGGRDRGDCRRFGLSSSGGVCGACC